jgi:hypothetical protein
MCGKAGSGDQGLPGMPAHLFRREVEKTGTSMYTFHLRSAAHSLRNVDGYAAILWGVDQETGRTNR